MNSEKMQENLISNLFNLYIAMSEVGENTPKSIEQKISEGEFDEIIKIFGERLTKINYRLQDSKPDFISPKETLQLFSPAICRTTLYNYTVKGLLTSYPTGGRVFYSRSEVIHQIKSKSIKKFKKK